jgi:hypothetical protein
MQWRFLTATAEHDWDRLLVQAQRHHVILAMKKMLNYLHQKLNAHVPAMILQKMSILNLSHAECIEYKVLINSGKITSPLQPFWFHYLQYLRFDTGGGFFRNLIGFQRYLQFFWHVDRLWQVPFLAVFKSMRMFWKMRMRNG